MTQASSGRGSARPSGPSPWGPRWSRWVGRGLARGYWNTEVRGAVNVPRSGPVVVIANHIGLADGPVMHGVIPRGSHFLIGDHMYVGPLGPLFTAAQQIKVVHGDRDSLVKALAVLRRGGVVGVFPEGTRGSGESVNVHGGAAWLALQGKAPVVPAVILGSRLTGEKVSVFPEFRRRMLVEFGEATTLELPAGVVGSARQEWARARLSELLTAQLRRTLESTDLDLPRDREAQTTEGGAHE